MTNTTSTSVSIQTEVIQTSSRQHPRSTRRLRGLTAALYAVLAFVVALSLGFSWGNVGNQDTYFIGALADADPTLFPRDWLVRETFLYHDTFRLLVRGLMLLGNVGLVSAITNLLLTMAGLALIARMLRDLTKAATPGLWALATLGLFLIIMAEQTGSVAVTYVFSSGLQPSVLAAVCWLAAFLLYFRERWLLSGLLLAVGGFWHSNFLVLGIPFFGFAHLLLGRNRLVPRWAAQLVPSVVVLLFELPTLLAASGAQGAAEAREIMQVFRSPNHYLPMTFLWGFLPYLFWNLSGLVAAFALRHDRTARLAGALLLASFVAVVSATLLTTVVYVPQVSQVFVWRIAPFGNLLAQLMLLAWMASPPANTLPWEPFLKAGLLAAAAGLGMVLLLGDEVIVSATLLIFTATGAGILVARQMPQSRRPQAVLAAFGLLAMLAATPRAMGSYRHLWATSTLMPPWQTSQQKALYDWVATTPKDALFLIPPEVGAFRILGLRSIVVDWKSTPMLPGELISWYRRIEAVSGVTAPRSSQQVIAGYRAMTPERLASLHRSFGFDYAMFKAPLPEGLPREAIRYRNESYIVLRLEPLR